MKKEKEEKNIEEIIEVEEVEKTTDDTDMYSDKEVTVMDMLNRIFVCLVIIAVVLTLNTIVLVCKGGTSAWKTRDEAPTTSEKEKDDEDEEEVATYDVSMMKEVDENGVLDIFKQEGVSVLYIGRPGCGFCVQYLPILQQAQTDYGYTTYYYDIDKMDSDSKAYKDMVKKLSYKYEMYYNGKNTKDTFGNWIGFTPMTVIIKDGKQVDGEIGAVDYEALSKMLEKNGLTKN